MTDYNSDFQRSPSPWLNAYIAFSRQWSPRAYEGFHAACALWLLSTIAARRVVLHLGRRYFTPLYIALVARTTLYAKSTTAAIALDTLAAAGLDWLLAPDNSTPRRFIHDLSLCLPENYAELTPEQRERVHKRLALTSQRGWFYDEFGQQLAALGRERGVAGDFRGILRRLDDCHEHYEVATTAGTDVVHRPYLALLANMTPADMRTLARRGGLLWNDGFWARFAFVAPPAVDLPAESQRFPLGERHIPPELVEPLVAWHERLGMPALTITLCPPDVTGATARLNVEPRTPAACTLGEGVLDAFYAYHDELVEIAQNSHLPDLDGSYGRLAEKALRVAMLIASLENDDHIELAQWNFGRQIAEAWRTSLHTLFDQVNSAPGDVGKDEMQDREEPSMEERLVLILQRHPRSTANEVARFVRGLDASEAKEFLDGLVIAGRLSVYVDGRTLRYAVD